MIMKIYFVKLRKIRNKDFLSSKENYQKYGKIYIIYHFKKYIQIYLMIFLVFH